MRRGFTVLEILLAMVLGTALLACLWSALSLYLRAFDSGRTEIEQTQLVRALFRKIETDVQRTLPQPKSAAPPVAPSSTTEMSTTEIVPVAPVQAESPAEQVATGGFPIDVPDNAALVGTAHQLRLRVCQPQVAQPMLPVVGETGQEMVRLPDDLKTIYYWLAEPDGGDMSGGAVGAATHQAAGLVRKEGPWLVWREDAASGGPSQPTQPGDITAADDPTPFYESRLPDLNTEQPDKSVVIAREVGGLEFRYFDGVAWVSEWNSVTQKRLPTAIEVSIFLREEEAAEQFATPTTSTSMDTPEELLPDYRAVVTLNATGATGGMNPPGEPGAISTLPGEAGQSPASSAPVPARSVP